jgi:hypothetical protein
MSSRRDPNWDLYSHPDEEMEESPDAGRQEDPPSDSDTEMEFEDVLFTTEPIAPPAQPATTTPTPSTPAPATPAPSTPAPLRSQGEFFMAGVIPVPAQPEAGGCGVCMEALSEDVVKLNCEHYYHTTCIHTWLTEHRTCPYCRCVLYENTGPSRQAESPRARPAQRPTLTPQTLRGAIIREGFRARINRSLDRTPTSAPRGAPARTATDASVSVSVNVSSNGSRVETRGEIRNGSNIIAARRERATGVVERMERFTQELQEVPASQIRRAIDDVGALVAENRAARVTPCAPRIRTPPMPQTPHPFDEWALGTNSSNNPPSPGESLSPTATRPPSTPTRTLESIIRRRAEFRSAFDHASTPRTPRRDPAAGDSEFARMLRRGQAEAGDRRNPATSVAPAFAPTLPRRSPALRDFTPGRAGDPTSTPRPSFLDPVPEQAEPGMTEQQRNDLITRAAVRLSSVEFAQFMNTLPAASADNTTASSFTPDPSESVGALLLEEDGDSPSLPDAESPSPSPRPPIYATIPPFTAAHISPDLLARAHAIAARNGHWFQDKEFFGFPSTNRVVNEPGFANLDVTIRERIFRQAMAELEDMDEMNDLGEVPALTYSSSSSSSEDEDEDEGGFFDDPAERHRIMMDIEDQIADIEDDPAERQRMMREIEDEIAEFEEEIPERRRRGSPNIEDEIADFVDEIQYTISHLRRSPSPDDESD